MAASAANATVIGQEEAACATAAGSTSADAEQLAGPSISLIGAAQLGAVVLNREFRKTTISHPILIRNPKILMC